MADKLKGTEKLKTVPDTAPPTAATQAAAQPSTPAEPEKKAPETLPPPATGIPPPVEQAAQGDEKQGDKNGADVPAWESAPPVPQVRVKFLQALSMKNKEKEVVAVKLETVTAEGELRAFYTRSFDVARTIKDKYVAVEGPLHDTLCLVTYIEDQTSHTHWITNLE